MRFRTPEPLVAAVVLATLGCGGSTVVAGTSGSPDGGIQAQDANVATDLPSTASLFRMIDDMDHASRDYPQVPAGSSAFFWSGARSIGLGNWFVSSPDGIHGDAHIDEIVPPRGDSKKAYHLTSMNHQAGVDLWAQLDHPRGRPVDLSAYAGVAFWARLNSPSSKLLVAVNDRAGGGFFDPTIGPSSIPSQALLVADQWQRFVLLFDDLGTDASAVVSFDFVAGDGGETFDLWIDDLALLCRGVCQSGT